MGGEREEDQLAQWRLRGRVVPMPGFSSHTGTSER